MTVFVADPDFTLHVGDALEVLRTLKAGSVDCCVTSPPYWGLRDYGTGTWTGGDPDCDHSPTDEQIKRAVMGASGLGTSHASQEEAARSRMMPRDTCPRCGATRTDSQLGLEPTPELYVANLVAVLAEVSRVLADHGTLWLNLGDSYAASRSYQVSDSKHKSHDFGESNAQKVPEGLKQKDLVGIPWRVAFALQADGWYLRSDIVWAKPNPMPESVTDRPTKAHEYVFLLSKRPRYWFDQEAVREPLSLTTLEQWHGAPVRTGNGQVYQVPGRSDFGTETTRGAATMGANPAGRNVRSVWEIATQPYPEAHFATFPEELPRRCIAAGCPEQVCTTCGRPRERMLESQRNGVDWNRNNRAGGDRLVVGQSASESQPADYAPPKTVGWSDCGHGDYRPGVVLDPFMGSATTALVARKLGRHAVGIELNPAYAELAARRLQQLSLLAEGAA